MILVDETDSLNVRTGPDASASVAFVLSHNETGVMRTAAPPDFSSVGTARTGCAEHGLGERPLPHLCAVGLRI